MKEKSEKRTCDAPSDEGASGQKHMIENLSAERGEEITSLYSNNIPVPLCAVQ